MIPNTLDTPSNPLVGFLPPDTDPPNGDGHINYTIRPKADLTTGTTLNAQASIVFDTNAAIATPQIVNTIDASPPASAVIALPATMTTSSFTVSWYDSDGAGPGIADYNVYVSDDGGAYTLWQSDTAKTFETYTGQVGHSYGFYSVSTDNIGLVQPTPTAPQATTTVINAPTPTPNPTPTPPPLVTVESLQVESIKVGKGRKAQQETVLVIDFSRELNAASADNASAYELAPIIKVKASGKGKNRSEQGGKAQQRQPRTGRIRVLRVDRDTLGHEDSHAVSSAPASESVASYRDLSHSIVPHGGSPSGSASSFPT